MEPVVTNVGAARNIYNHGQVVVAAQKRPREITIDPNTGRDAASFNAQDLVVEIHQALTTKQRLVMLRHVHQVVSSGGDSNNSQNDPFLFLQLLEAGTLDALLLQFNYILHRRHGGTIAQEVVDLCRVLALFLRNCPSVPEGSTSCQDLALQILSCFGRQRHSELHPQRTATSAASSSSEFMLLLSHTYQQWPIAQLHILAILHAVSGHEYGTRLVLQCRNILLSVIVDAMRNCCCCYSQQQQQDSHQQQNQQHDSNNINNNSNEDSSHHALLQVLGLIKNISYFQKDSWIIMMEIPGFLKALSSLTSQNNINIVQEHCNKSRERLSAIWRNFAVSQGNHHRTRTSMTQHDTVITSICCLVINSNSNDNSDATDMAVYRNFLTILISLSIDSVESCLLLMLHGDGIIPNNILPKLLQYTIDDVVRKRAARTLRLWASHDSTGALLVHSCPTILQIISKMSHSDISKHVRNEASEAFVKCTSYIVAPMPQQNAILDALQCLCQVSLNVTVIARALKGQALHVTNRLLLAKRPIFINALTSIALEVTSPSIARTDACCALADLAAEQGNRRRLLVLESEEDSGGGENHVANGETTTTTNINHQLLEALRVNVLTNNHTIPAPRGDTGNSSRRCDYAAQALVYLADNNIENRNIMSRHAPQLLSALIQYAAHSDSNNVIKHHVKRIILLMVQEL